MLQVSHGLHIHVATTLPFQGYTVQLQRPNGYIYIYIAITFQGTMQLVVVNGGDHYSNQFTPAHAHHRQKHTITTTTLATALHKNTPQEYKNLSSPCLGTTCSGCCFISHNKG